MKVENEKTKSETEFRLAPSHFNQCIQRRSCDGSSSTGAGANADSGLDMKFVASDPLSELVWSPENGLSLRLTDCSFDEKNPNLLRSVRPSSINISHGMSNTDKPSDEENFAGSLNVLHERTENMAGNRCYAKEVNTDRGMSVQDVDKKGDLCDLQQKCTSGPTNIHMAEAFEAMYNLNSVLPENEAEPDLAQNEPLFVNPTDKGVDVDSGNQTPQVEVVVDSDEHRMKECKADKTGENKNEGKATNSHTILPLERLESSAENDIQASVNKNACGVLTNIIEPKSAHKIGSFSNENSPTSSRVLRYQRKGKEKVLLDGDVNMRMLKEDDNDEDESHESVESCNSTRLVSSGKRQWNFDQRMIEGSKKLKTESSFKNKSSFMNWISNMMKGSQFDQDKAPSLALTLAHHNHGNDEPERKPNSESKIVGFRSIFESICNGKTKDKEKLLDDDHRQKENKISVDATPIACFGVDGNLGKQLLVSNEKSNNSLLGRKLALENKNSYNIAAIRGKGETGSTSSMDNKPRMSSAENIESGSPVEGKTGYNLSHGSNPLASSWMARFTTKTSFPSINLEYGNQNNASEIEASISSRRTEGGSDQKSKYKVNLILPSPILKNSEAMASVFSRRLDALKHIMASDDGNGGSGAVACFFCGKKGHNVRNCSEITNSDFEGLMRNVDSYNGEEVVSRLCIRCFQLNHWAASCPNMSSKVQKPSHFGVFSGNDRLPAEMKRNQIEENTKLMDVNPGLETELKINWKPNKDASSFKDYFASTYRGNNLKENRIVPFHNVVNRQISEVQKRIFDAIIRLRLSRADIVKWMKSHISFARLDGFFLRLRLGKWEEGLGGTGYYVACVTGPQRENSPQKSKSLISVNVGGIKCLVESQYISNQDFLEDELVAWWCSTTKSGSQIPSEEDFRQKIEKRKILGL